LGKPLTRTAGGICNAPTRDETPGVLRGVEHDGEKIFWKIDYYDRSLTKGSEDPSDSTRTTRVLTIMLASEY